MRPVPRVPLPPRLVEQARAYADGTAAPTEPRDAATVVLLRDGDQGVEVYLLRRRASMAFAGGMCVYPGGGVDRRDFDAQVTWAGPTPAAWAQRLACSEDLAEALVCAAVRETFEESGVLLAGPTPDSVVADTTAADWEADRAALESKDLSFTDFLVRRELVLRSDLLGVWAAWTTPVFEPRRFRTWFFAAVLPEGQVTREVSTESDAVSWLPAGDALAAVDREEISMMPPTYLTCLDVAQHATAGEVLAEAQGRTAEMFTPEVVADADEFALSTPPQYDRLLGRR